jgi:hypothetical protein
MVDPRLDPRLRELLAAVVCDSAQRRGPRRCVARSSSRGGRVWLTRPRARAAGPRHCEPDRCAEAAARAVRLAQGFHSGSPACALPSATGRSVRRVEIVADLGDAAAVGRQQPGIWFAVRLSETGVANRPAPLQRAVNLRGLPSSVRPAASACDSAWLETAAPARTATVRAPTRVNCPTNSNPSWTQALRK